MSDHNEEKYLQNKLNHALSLKEASERLIKENIHNADAVNKCFQTLSLSTRMVNHFKNKKRNLSSDLAVDRLFSKNFEGFSGYIRGI